MYTSPLLSGSNTAGSYFNNIAGSKGTVKNSSVTGSMTPTQIRRQLQVQFSSVNFGLTANEQQQVNSYYSQLNSIYGVNDNSIREEQEQRFQELKKELDDLYGISSEPKELSLQEKEKVEELQTQLDELYNILPTKDPQGADRQRAESLKWELKKLHYPEGKVLSAAEIKKEDSIQAELKELFGIEGPKTLNEEEQARADDLNRQIDEIQGTLKKELSPEEEKRADEIIAEMEQIVGSLVTQGLSNAEKDLFYRMDKEAEGLKAQAKERELSDSEQDKLAELNKNIDTLIDKAAKIQQQQDSQAKQVHNQVGGFFSQLGMMGGGTMLSRSI